MKALHVLSRAACAASLVLAVLCAGVPRQASAATGSPSLAGHWVVHLLWRCAPGAGHGDAICLTALFAPGPVTWVGTFDIESDATGRASYTYEATVAGAGSGVSRQCNARLYVSAVTGVCPMTAHGKGYFDPAGVVFYSTDEWVTFYGAKVVRAVHNAMTYGGWKIPDWPIPPQPGYYDDDTVSKGHDAMNVALQRLEPFRGIEYVAVVARY
jgi:hypothetical protein